MFRLPQQFYLIRYRVIHLIWGPRKFSICRESEGSSRPMGDCRGCDNSGYGTLRYWTPQAAIGNRRGNTRRNIAEYRTDYGMHLLSDVATRGRKIAFGKQVAMNVARRH